MSTVAALVADLQARGVTLEPRGDRLAVRPVSQVTREELSALRHHKPEVLRLLAPEPALAHRVAAFRRQLDEWTTSGRVGAPVFGLPGVAVTLGQCVGCGETLAEGRTWRCAVCVRAVEQTLGLLPLEEPAP